MKRRARAAAAALAVAVALLAGCAAPSAGYVRDKDHHAAYTTWHPQSCTTRQVPSGTYRDARGYSWTKYRQERACTPAWVERHRERWSLLIVDTLDGDGQSGWVDVTESVYERAKTGDWYDTKTRGLGDR